jgi:branched-chain amino acid transport system substrate-binding protein
MGLDEIAWLGCDGNHGSGMFKDARSSQFMAKAVVAGTRTAEPSGVTYDKFAAAYTDKFGEAPEVYCDTTYDCARLICKAIEKAGKYDGEAIRNAMLEVGQNYDGASGTVSFTEKGDRVSGAFEVWKVEKDPAAEYGYKNVKVKIVHLD